MHILTRPSKRYVHQPSSKMLKAGKRVIKQQEKDTGNPLCVDYRVGSADLVPYLAKVGVPVEKADLLQEDSAADCEWVGNGEEGAVLVGVERKNISDLVSSMRSGRSHVKQISSMCRVYDVRMMLVEGLWRPGEDGELMVWRKGGWVQLNPSQRWPVRYGEVYNYLESVSKIARFHVIRTSGVEETAGALKYSWRWWQKEWDEHNALGVGGVGGAVMDNTSLGRVRLVKPNLVWRIASQLTGIGALGREASRWFRTPRDMVLASVGEWEQALTVEQKGKGGGKGGRVVTYREKAASAWRELNLP